MSKRVHRKDISQPKRYTSNKKYTKNIKDKGVLKKFGYADVKHLTSHERHNRLRRINRYIKDSLGLFSKLNRLAIMNKTQDPELAKIFKNDAKWVCDELGSSSSSRKSSSFRKSSSSRHRNNKGNSKSGSKTSSRKKSGYGSRKSGSKKSSRIRASNKSSGNNSRRISRSNTKRTSGSKTAKKRNSGRK